MAAGDGLISMKPTSIAYSGTSASINADGGIDFVAMTALSVNGVFTSSYENYLITFHGVPSTQMEIGMNLRASGVDATAANYDKQQLIATSTTVQGYRNTGETAFFGINVGGTISGSSIGVWGPYLASKTSLRTISSFGLSGAYILDLASVHSLSTSYDGMTFTPSTGDVTGNIHIFGYEE